MFDKKFNIIIGLNNTGKTTLLRDISNDFKNQLGYKVYWIIPYHTDDIKYMKEISELTINVSNTKYDIKSITILKEIYDRGNIDYIFIDDYDLLNDELRYEINKIKCKKVLTTSHKFFQESDEILKTISNGDLDYLFLNKLTGVNKYTVIKDEETYFINDFRKILLRDKKINNLLDE
jgi:molybdopterin-guanine dinucleotide biosynthesis protein